MLGIIHYKCFGLDGVSLEIQKRVTVLEHLKVPYLLVCGEKFNWLDPLRTHFYSVIRDGQEFPSLNKQITEATSLWLRIFRNFKLQGLVVHNLFSLPLIPAVSEGLLRAVGQINLPIISHNHDFWHIRAYFPRQAREYLSDKFPPMGEGIFHKVINTQDTKYFDVSPRVIGDFWLDYKDGNFMFNKKGLIYGGSFKTPASSLIFLQATRIIPRKGIENAIAFVSAFKKLSGKDAKILFTNKTDVDRQYLTRLKRLAKKLNVQLEFSDNFWQGYKKSDFVMYPSLVEGFGNQFLEAVYFKRLPIVFEYPVFKKDIKPLGFEYISLGSKTIRYKDFQIVERSIINKAVLRLLEYINSPKRLKAAVDTNYELLNKYFGPNALLMDILTDLKLLNMVQ